MKASDQFSYAARDAQGSIHKRTLDSGEWWLDGYVETPHGYVVVYSQGHQGLSSAASSYRIVVDGRVHVISEDVARRERGLAIMAGRFARSVAGAGQ